ncbi:MAG: polysaccharide deacetylase family protein [Kribbellaceae bacterium]|nr:polysaccharide deacetylase family protein [Kribbellaceae bacterium]
MFRALVALAATGLASIMIAACSAGPNGRPPASGASPPTRTASTSPNQVHPPPPNPTAAALAGGKKVIFLTFDDGPDPAWTPKILQVLAKYGAHATFFEVGRMQVTHPGLSEQVTAAGDAIGSHTVSHQKLTSLPPARLHHEIFDGPKSTCLRPPDGATNHRVRSAITAAGMVQVLWTVDPRDWARPGVAAIERNVLGHARPGAIVLMHDGGGNRSQTVAALDTVLRVLKQQGYSFPAMDCFPPHDGTG